MSFYHVQGDIFEIVDSGKATVFVHGCNCFHRMKSGIAGKVAERWPAAARADKATKYGDPEKLGDFSIVKVPRRPDPFATQQPFIEIINAYTQFRYGREPGVVYADYSAITNVMLKVVERYRQNPEAMIVFPFIGAGLAKGDPDRLMKIYKTVFSTDGAPHATLVTLDSSPSNSTFP